MSHSERMAALGPDKNECFVLRTCAVYLDRLFECFQMMDGETIKLLTWILGTEVTAVGEYLLNSMNQREKRKFAADLAEDARAALRRLDEFLFSPPGPKLTTANLLQAPPKGTIDDLSY